MKYMLDTNMCIYAQKKNESVLAKLKEHWQEGIAISLITLAELEYGVKVSAAPEQNSIALMKFLSIVEILPFDTGAAEEYGNICAFLGEERHTYRYNGYANICSCEAGRLDCYY